MTRTGRKPARYLRRLYAAVLLLFALTSFPTAGQFLPVEVSDNGRFLQKSDGSPFFWIADTAWSLQRLNPAEVDQYMANRKEKGFTVIQGPLVLSENPDYQGHVNVDPENLNEAWMQHIDVIVESAADHGLYIAPVLAGRPPALDITVDNGYDFGFTMGQRFRDQPNIAAFIIGHEFNYPEPRVAVWDQVAQGLLAAPGSQPRLITAHPRWYGGYEDQSSGHHLHHFPWLSFNMLQSSLYGDCTNDPDLYFYLGVHNWLLIEHDYARVPIKPVLDGEATYEMQNPHHHKCDLPQPPRWSAFGVRRRAYWSVFAGGFGHTYGANGVFQFHKKDDPQWDWAPLDYWEQAMDYPGSTQMGYLRRLMESRPFFTRVPGQGFLLSPPNPDVPVHVHATRDSSGAYAFVYIPEAGRTVTVDMDFISGNEANAWWFDPATAEATFIGTYDEADYGPGASLSFTTAPVGEDWVLVIDDASRGFGPPGEPGEPCRCEPCIEDLDGDGSVGFPDLILVISEWGPCWPCTADLDGDGTVGLADLVQLLAQWGPCGGCAADIDGDGVVGFADLLQLVVEFDACTDECPADIDGGGVGFSDLTLLLHAWGDC